MDNHLDILHKLALDKGINRRERDMLIALKAFDFENSNVISVGLQTLLDYFCIKNKECIYSVLRTLQSKNYIRIEKKNGIKNVYVIIKDYLLGKDSRYNDATSTGYADVTGNLEGGYINVPCCKDSRYTDETSEISRHADVSTFEEGRYPDVPSTRYDDVSTSPNNIYINKNNNKIYINIINHWNSKKIGKYVSLNIKVIDSINKAMTKYSFDEIKKAIDNYAKVYNSDYFYDFQWHLSQFLTRDNAIGKFIDAGDIWLRYKKKYYTLKDEYEEWGINTEDYINSI